MIKASALYIVIVIALVIAVLCSSLIVSAYYYRAEYQKKFRYDKLQNNLSSGINILLTVTDSSYNKERTFSLFGRDDDSVSLKKTAWGIYDIGVVRSFIQGDTLYKAFSIANSVDSSKWAALYIADEDRAISVSGKTLIRGDAYLPKAGIQQAYVDNKAYEGDKRLVIGKKLISAKKLPDLDTNRLRQLNQYFTAKGDNVFDKDSVQQSFLKLTKIFDFKKHAYTLSHVYLKGNIILHSDTTLTIDSTVKLDNVTIYAPVIIINGGFKGNCQLFATDSVSAGANCRFEYPSCIGIIRFVSPRVNSHAKITLGENSMFSGQIFTYEKKPSELLPTISIGKKDTIKGNIYSQSVLELKDKAVVYGGVITHSFLYKSSFTLYENYLINISIDSKNLSPYYLTSELVPVAKRRQKPLKWLEGN
jgi:hypothetical protein